jgi:hypothetical protein
MLLKNHGRSCHQTTKNSTKKTCYTFYITFEWLINDKQDNFNIYERNGEFKVLLLILSRGFADVRYWVLLPHSQSSLMFLM